MLCVSTNAGVKYLKTLAVQIAVSNATDLVTAVVNEQINEKMSEGRFDYDYFVTLHRDDAGEITAVSSNMTRINSLAAEILREIISSTRWAVDIGIPVET